MAIKTKHDLLMNKVRNQYENTNNLSNQYVKQIAQYQKPTPQNSLYGSGVRQLPKQKNQVETSMGETSVQTPIPQTPTTTPTTENQKYNWHEFVTDYARFMGNFKKNLLSTTEDAVDSLTNTLGKGYEFFGKTDTADKIYDFSNRNLTNEYLNSDFNKYLSYYSNLLGLTDKNMSADDYANIAYGNERYLPGWLEVVSSSLGSLAPSLIGTKLVEGLNEKVGDLYKGILANLSKGKK